MNYAIQVEGLRKSYGGRAVLKGLDLQIEKGEIFALLGVNGAGKTTTLECIEGLRTCSGGRVAVHGRVGIQLQSSSLPAHIRPMEAVRLFAKWNRAAADPAMLAALGIDALAKKQYVQLSTGQKRRLHLALALIGDPDIVFLDEPTAGLDVEGRVQLHDQIRRLKAQGKTIILASHDMAEVEALCDRIAILSGGAIAYLGPVSGLAEAVGGRCTITIQTPQGEESIRSNDLSATLLALLEGCREKGVPVLDVHIDHGSLEQNFIHIAGGNGK